MSPDPPKHRPIPYASWSRPSLRRDTLRPNLKKVLPFLPAAASAQSPEFPKSA